MLGGPLAEVLADTPVAPQRLLLIDGAEAMLEGRGDTFCALATAALEAGLAVVAVTRSDASRAVGEALADLVLSITTHSDPW